MFRKDEESAWTIVASGAYSSVHTSETVSTDTRDENESLYSVKLFSFTNDLLTAPVYKRLALNMLRHPGKVQKPSAVRPSPATARLAERAVPLTASKASFIRSSTTTIVRRKAGAHARDNCSEDPEPDTLRLMGDAAGEIFSPSTISDLDELRHDVLRYHPVMRGSIRSSLRFPKYLPLQATLKREQKTSENQHKLDLQLCAAAQSGSLDEIAALLDDGADINPKSFRISQMS